MEVVTANRSNTLGGAKPTSLPRSRRKTQAHSSQEPRQRSFLNHRFEALPIFDVKPIVAEHIAYRIEDGEPQLWLAKEKIAIVPNLINLRKSAEAYCKVHCGLVPAKLDEHPLRQLQQLYQAMLKCKPTNNEIGIDYDHKSHELTFLEYGWCEYPDCCLAFLTLAYLDRMKDPHRQFFKEVLSLARATMQTPCPEDHFDFAYAVGYFDIEYIEDLLNDDPEYAEMVKSYQNGHVNDLITEVCKTPWHNLFKGENLEERVKHLIQCTNDTALEEFIKVAYEGVVLMGKECIAEYRQNLNHCEINEFDSTDDCDEVLTIDRITGLCYDDEESDPVARVAIDTLNNDGCNYTQEELYEVCEITEHYDKPFQVSNFPKRWFEWFAKFNRAKWNYEQAHANVERHVHSEDGDNRL